MKDCLGCNYIVVLSVQVSSLHGLSWSKHSVLMQLFMVWPEGRAVERTASGSAGFFVLVFATSVDQRNNHTVRL